MSIKEHFEPVTQVHHARNDEEFLRAVRMSPQNSYLEGDAEGITNRPLLTILGRIICDHEPSGFEYFYTQDSNGIISACTTIQDDLDRENTIQLMEISTHPDYRNQKLAKSLLLTIMRHTYTENKQLIRGSFQEDGFKYLMHLYQELHALVPELKIIHNNTEPVDFLKPYHLEYAGDGEFNIIYD